MKFLTSGHAIERKLLSLIDDCKNMEWAVAWASTGHPVYNSLMKNKNKISKFTVGVDFYQTHPDFLGQFIEFKNVRVAQKSGGVFHPKVFFFEMDEGWECVLGSANFTKSAFSKNEEVAVVLSSRDVDSHSEVNRLRKKISSIFTSGAVITKQFVHNYQNIWTKNRHAIGKLTNDYGEKKSNKYMADSDIFSMGWKEFLSNVRTEGKVSLNERLMILEKAQGWLMKDSLINLDTNTRRKLGGYFGVDEETDWGWFGSMVGAGRFKNMMNQDCRLISEALDQIPPSGEVTKLHYGRFSEKYCECFSKGYLATGTRLLAMKRPDYFVCLDGPNKQVFCSDFGISAAGLNLNNYWDEVVERVVDCVWWSANPPKGEIASKVWAGRAALIDVLYYDDEDYSSLA